jgi:hypothetical protein
MYLRNCALNLLSFNTKEKLQITKPRMFTPSKVGNKYLTTGGFYRSGHSTVPMFWLSGKTHTFMSGYRCVKYLK